MLRSVFGFFHPRRLPLMTRQSYRCELLAAVVFPIAVMFSHQSVVQVLADKAFGASKLVIATITAAPLFCMLSSLAWARLSRGLPKVRFINMLQLGIVAGVASIAFLPRTEAGSWMLTGIVIACACLGVGIITLRSVVWRMNYPRHTRGRVTGRLSMVMTCVLVGSSLGAGALLKDEPGRYVWVYPLGAALALFGVWFYSRVRLRGQAEHLREERRPIEFSEEPAPGFWAILRQDRAYRRYMICQFIVGMANMMLGPVLVVMISDDWNKDFLLSVAVLTALPHMLILLTMPMWAKLLDKSHVLRVRVRQGWFWAAGMALMGLGGYRHSLILVAVGIAVRSIAFGGGALAWNLGHNDFASRRMVSAYMGVHVTLAGVRGLIAPYLGIVLYAGTPALTLPAFNMTLPQWNGIGSGVYFVAAALAVIGSVGFFLVARDSAVTRLAPSDA